MDNERNLSLEIIDEIINEKSTENEGFVIDNDEKAEWAIRKLSEERGDTQRYIDVCRAMILEYEEKIKKAEEKLKSKTSFLEGLLNKFFQSVTHKITKNQESYKLPSGSLKLKYQQSEYKRNDAVLLKWLKDNKMNAFVKIEEKPNWVELKKLVNISGDRVVTEDGQIIEGINVVERPPVFEIEL